MILLLDNYDSFVHNLARYLRCLGIETRVVRSDAIDALSVADLQPDAIVLSPGPKRPSDAGCCVEVVRQLGHRIPILGICLGHQAIGQAFGASVVTCPPAHGIASEVRHAESGLFAGCPSPMRVGRYHSLAVAADSIPPGLVVTSETADGIVMSMQHRESPIYGVQFHPESILSDFGDQVLRNFVTLSKRFAPCPASQVGA